MNQNDVVRKIDKLKNFVERDCGNESLNAIRIIYNLINDYQITPHQIRFRLHPSLKNNEFAKKIDSRFFMGEDEITPDELFRRMKEAAARQAYGNNANTTNSSSSQREESKKEKKERKSNTHEEDARRYSYSDCQWYEVSYTSIMKKIIIALINRCHLKYEINKNKIRVFCTSAEHIDFIQKLENVKKVWRYELDKIDDKIIHDIDIGRF